MGEQQIPNPEMQQWARQRLNGLQPLPRSLCQVEQLSPTVLAYIGDGVYELLMRMYYLIPPQRIAAYHQDVVAQVRAEQQAAQLTRILPHLTPLEQDLCRRGRNAAKRPPARLDPAIYQQASSLETLFGYLYLTNPPRLSELLDYFEF